MKPKYRFCYSTTSWDILGWWFLVTPESGPGYIYGNDWVAVVFKDGTFLSHNL